MCLFKVLDVWLWSWARVCQVPVCFIVSGLFVNLHRVYIYSHVYFYIRASASILSVSVDVCVCVSGNMCNWAKTILKGDIRDGWITENLLKRDNPSCALIRHTPWFSNRVFSIILAVTEIPSRHSAQVFTPHSFLLLLPCPWLCTNCKPFRLPW